MGLRKSLPLLNLSISLFFGNHTALSMGFYADK